MKINTLIDTLKRLEQECPDAEVILFNEIKGEEMVASANIATLTLPKEKVVMLLSSEDAKKIKELLEKEKDDATKLEG